MPLRVRPVLLILLATAMLAPRSGASQDPNAAARVARAQAKLAPIGRMLGQWEGEAMVTSGPGGPMRVAQSEDIVAGAGGSVLFIRGTGRSTDAADRGRIVFEAAALVWYDAEADKVRMVTHRDGRSVEPTVEIRPDTIVWSFPVPGGSVRYTIALTADTWHEVGHFLREGAAPVGIIEMRLRRTR
jgi:hypothetical protein